MTMKKFLTVALGLPLVIVVIVVAVVYLPKLGSLMRGIKPVINPPPKDIASPSFNTTGLPLQLPSGFSIAIFAQNVLDARVMTWDPAGRMLVSLTSEGKVVALPDEDVNWQADRIITVLDGLNRPHGLASKCEGNAAVQKCWLYVAETNKIVRYDYDQSEAKASNPQKIADLPSGAGHFTRTIVFGPDDRLYVSIGSSCNVCIEKDARRAAIYSMKADGSDFRSYATGLRNAVFFTWSFVDGRMWATEMGRDFLGDDLPPDEINVIQEGGNYGWPICYGKNIHDTNFDKNVYIQDPCVGKAESMVDLQAHSAPLGLAFIPEEGWPEDYWYDLLVAYHGSWNRSEPTGYKVVRVKLDARGNFEGLEDFITGYLTKEGALGRPVDILVQPGGIVYISDDKAGVIYRAVYNQTQSKDVIINNPDLSQPITSPLVIEGQAIGSWFFEASFPVKLLDGNGQQIAIGIAQAQSDWMTDKFVPFRAELIFSSPPNGTGTLVLEKDNPSGLPENAAEVQLSVRFK